jgi:hypothetical protein
MSGEPLRTVVLLKSRNIPDHRCTSSTIRGACDFILVHDLLFRTFYIFATIELQTCRVTDTAVTMSPADAWTAQRLQEATPLGEALIPHVRQ